MTAIDAPIVAVTVFGDQARITRRGAAALDAGEQTLSLGGLPAMLAPDSVRVSGRGSGVRVLGVDVASEYVAQPPEESAAELTRRLEELQEEDRALGDEDGLHGARLDFLKQLRESGGAGLGRGLAFGHATIETVESLATYLAREQESIAAARREVGRRRRELAREIEGVKWRLDQLRPPEPQERRVLRVTVEAAAATDVELELAYVVYGASWQPVYDLRLAGETLSVGYLALVSQRTGEDWPAVSLALSTARPAVSPALPELDPWYLDALRPMPRPVARAAAPAAMAKMESAAYEALADTAMLAGAPPIEVAEVSVESGGAAVTYRVARPVAVPSDGSPHRANVTTLELPARLDYLTAPKLAEEVYLRARIVNASDFTLLPGAASIFHGDEFVGTTHLETVAPGEEFEVQLGLDDRVKIERELVGRNVSKTLIGNVRRSQFAYRIKVRSLLPGPARVTVLDQLPVSRHEEIKVKLLDVTPRPAEQSDLNILRWELSLQPRQVAEITLSFSVEHPRDLQVVGISG